MVLIRLYIQPQLVRDYSHTTKLLDLVLEYGIKAGDEELILQQRQTSGSCGRRVAKC